MPLFYCLHQCVKTILGHYDMYKFHSDLLDYQHAQFRLT